MSILLPLDPNEPSPGALRLATLLASAFQTNVIALAARADEPEIEVLASLYARTAPIREAGVRARLRTTGGGGVDAILDEARTRGCEWIVLESGGDPDDGDALVGTHTAEVMARSPVPVAAVLPSRVAPAPQGCTVAVIGGRSGQNAAFVGEVIAQSCRANARPFRVNPASYGPALLPEDGGPKHYCAVVAAFDSRRQPRRPVVSVLRQQQWMVVLVGGPSTGAGGMVC